MINRRGSRTSTSETALADYHRQLAPGAPKYRKRGHRQRRVSLCSVTGGVKEDIPIRKPIVLRLAGLVFAVFLGISLWNWQAGLQRRRSSEEGPLEGLQSFGAVPDFSLIERDGRRITLSDLKDKVWIVNFIYTNCPDPCPIQSAQLRKIHEEFRNEKDLRLVSITVDPTRDTPQVLSEYATRFSADPERWLFLTGEKETIYKLAHEGFHLGAVEIPHEQRPGSGATHTHSPRFVLIDRETQIRGYYVSTQAEAMRHLPRDLKILVRDESASHGRTTNEQKGKRR